MPILNAQQQLFDAAERVLLHDGPNGLTSRAVTAEAGVAKGLLHRHFADIDAFLVELVLDRITRLGAQKEALLDSTGTGTIVDNLTDALVGMFSPIAVAIVALTITRDSLRTRLREAGTARIPLLGEGMVMIRTYLTAERDLGRLANDADVSTLAPTLAGAVHLLCTEQENAPPDRTEVHKIATTVIGSA